MVSFRVSTFSASGWSEGQNLGPEHAAPARAGPNSTAAATRPASRRRMVEERAEPGQGPERVGPAAARHNR